MSGWTTVFLVYSLKQREQLEIHQGLKFLGDIFLAQGDERRAINLFTVALEGFTYMDVHRSRAECLLRLGDIFKGHGNLLKAVELWETAKLLFERSSQAKQVKYIQEKPAEVGEDVLQQHKNNLAHLVELNAPSGIVDELEDNIPEIDDLEVDLDEATMPGLVESKDNEYNTNGAATALSAANLGTVRERPNHGPIRRGSHHGVSPQLVVVYAIQQPLGDPSRDRAAFPIDLSQRYNRTRRMNLWPPGLCRDFNTVNCTNSATQPNTPHFWTLWWTCGVGCGLISAKRNGLHTSVAFAIPSPRATIILEQPLSGMTPSPSPNFPIFHTKRTGIPSSYGPRKNCPIDTHDDIGFMVMEPLPEEGDREPCYSAMLPPIIPGWVQFRAEVGSIHRETRQGMFDKTYDLDSDPLVKIPLDWVLRRTTRIPGTEYLLNRTVPGLKLSQKFNQKSKKRANAEKEPKQILIHHWSC
ncbi:hypothetical protein B0H13DRAFT_1892245 [Mycena leptocephala]|nr:hypothetical protein B0H13DRAFT_1892245 [Mycena leptocephala]